LSNVRYVQPVDSPEPSCPICANGEPLDIVAEFANTWITAQSEAPLPGYVCVVSKRHVVEPFELPTPELIAFWEEAMLAAQTVSELFRPTKMNYEIHGNTIPHLHLHLYPRFADDPYAGGPIDARLARFKRSSEQLSAIRQAFKRDYAGRKREQRLETARLGERSGMSPDGSGCCIEVAMLHGQDVRRWETAPRRMHERL
jgi:diadenosine tetraphosphate (Ap4A) HIT family hydrolase